MKRIPGVLLAAGASTRFGECKQLLDWEGKPLVVHAADTALEAPLEPVIVVLGCQAEKIRAALQSQPVQTVMNWRWQEGMSTSVQTGLAALPPEADGAVFLQCDQPLLTPELLQAVVARFEETDAPIVHPTYRGQRSTPVLFARRLFPELAAVTGDEGGRGLIARHADDVATVEVDDPDLLADVDTPEDYEQLLEVSGSAFNLKPETPRPETVLSRIRHLIIDMDGVLWRGDEAMPGLQAFFDFLRRRDIGFVLATNNSSKTPEQYVDKLARFGIDVAPQHVLTSALVTAAYLADTAPAGSRVHPIGEEGIRQALEEQGFELSDDRPSYVVVGWDRGVSWSKLAKAALLINDGATFVGTNPDVNYPTERGPVPGTGALLAALEVTTGVQPIVAGKPERRMYEEALRRLEASARTTAMIGDRIETDILGAKQAGLLTVLVLSGIATEADLADSCVKPDLVCADIRELAALWKRALSEG